MAANAPQNDSEGFKAPIPAQQQERTDFELPEGFVNADTAEQVRLAQEGDVEALNALFTRCHALIVDAARRKCGPKLLLKETPFDLAQTTFREATRDFQKYQYRGEGSLLRWLIKILQNKIRDKAEFYAAGKRDTSLETSLDAPADDSDSGSSRPEPKAEDLSVTRQVQRGERFEHLGEALEQLTPEYREAIVLVFFKGHSLREAGQIMGGRSEDALRMMLRRAESKLFDILRRSMGDDGTDTV